MKKNLTITGTLVAFMAIGVGGCGSGDDAGAEPASSATTQAEFIDQGDAILCTKSEAVDHAMTTTDFDSASNSELKGFVFDGVLPAVETAYDGLASIPVPAGDEDQIEAVLTGLSNAIETTKSNPAQLITGPDPFAKADALITAYGLTGCAV